MKTNITPISGIYRCVTGEIALVLANLSSLLSQIIVSFGTTQKGDGFREFSRYIYVSQKQLRLEPLLSGGTHLLRSHVFCRLAKTRYLKKVSVYQDREISFFLDQGSVSMEVHETSQSDVSQKDFESVKPYRCLSEFKSTTYKENPLGDSFTFQGQAQGHLLEFRVKNEKIIHFKSKRLS